MFSGFRRFWLHLSLNLHPLTYSQQIRDYGPFVYAVQTGYASQRGNSTLNYTGSWIWNQQFSISGSSIQYIGYRPCFLDQELWSYCLSPNKFHRIWFTVQSMVIVTDFGSMSTVYCPQPMNTSASLSSVFHSFN